MKVNTYFGNKFFYAFIQRGGGPGPTHLLETARPLLEAMVWVITGTMTLSLHHDISTVTRQEFVLCTLADPPRLRETKKKSCVRNRRSPR